MKKIFTLFAFLLLVGTAQGQAPQGIPYQAAARNSSGAVIASTAISVRFTIRDSIATGAIKYRETHSTTTDANGMFSLTVGQGTPVSGTFASINWGTNAKFLQVELDPAGGSSYIDMGTQQMMSVPYSIYSSNGFTPGITGDIMFYNGTNWVKLPAGVDGQVLTMSGGLPVWSGCYVSAGLITGTATVCAGGTTALSNATTGGVWSSSAAGVSTVGSTGVVTGVAAGTATISYTVTNSCGSAVTTRVVTVNAPSAGTITGTATVTAGSTTALSNATTGGAWSSSATGIATVGSTGIVSGVAAGTATISYTVTNGCGSAMATRVVTVTIVGTTFAGGVIAYILQPGDPGYITGEMHGLIAAPSDQSTGIQWWNLSSITTGATATALVTGMANTNAIVAAQGVGSYAARLCANLVLNGYSDWYLPSRDELNKLYTNKINIGGFINWYYWSSSEYNALYAWYVNFSVGSAGLDDKYFNYHVRAVRAFSYPEAISGISTVCVGSTTTLSSATTGGTWSSSNTGVATVDSSGVVSGVSAGTATISYTATGGFGTGTITRIVTVNPLPSAGTITGTATVTVSSTTALSNATTGGIWSSSNTGIFTVGSGGVVSGVAEGTATVSYTVTNSCGSAVATRIVTVSPFVFAVGASYGGGKIAYILHSGDPGYVAGETHGLIAATTDQSTGIMWSNGFVFSTTGASDTALGTGLSNTNTIVAALGAGDYAAKLCADLVSGGYSDWYLPSIEELSKLYINRSSIGGFSTGRYWSSSEFADIDYPEFDGLLGKLIDFNDGSAGPEAKVYAGYVRAIRYF